MYQLYVVIRVQIVLPYPVEAEVREGSRCAGRMKTSRLAYECIHPTILACSHLVDDEKPSTVSIESPLCLDNSRDVQSHISEARSAILREIGRPAVIRVAGLHCPRTKCNCDRENP